MELGQHPEQSTTGPNGKDEKLPAAKLHAAQYLVALILAVLITGLWRLQVLNAESFRSLAEANRIRKVPMLAPRGRLFDREGRLLVDNYPSVSCYLLREQVKDLDADLPLISQGLHIPVEQIQATIRRFQIAPKYQPIPLKLDITPDEQAFIAAHRDELPELETLDEQRRLYPRDGFAAHLIGYVGEVSEQMLDDPRYAFYSPGDVVGRSGVEQTYDALLRGKDGSRDVIVNSHGKELFLLGQELAVPGKDLKLTIDLDLQIAAEKALDGKNGAIVAMDPHTGEILAMVSRPTFDPNDFAVRVSRDEWNKLVTDPDKPLLNKAIQAQLAPGSTFKIIMSVAGWQEGIAQDLHVNCTGGAEFYGRRFGCWVKGGHGPVSLEKAIYQSCDVFFYTLAEKLGIDRIARYATAFGLGQKTGIDLPNEVTGVMPSEEWKIRNFKQKWFAGETISVGIGQGAVAITPVQLMRAIGAISMDGHMVVPHVINPTNLPQGFVETTHYSEVKEVPIDSTGWETITDAMSRVLLPEGTAPSAHVVGIDIAGKTGSAQIVSLATRARFKNSEELAQNGWFVGFTPRRNPDIVVCVLFQGGEHGRLAARLATQVIKAYVDKQRRVPTKMGEQPKSNGTVEIGGLWTDPDSDGHDGHKETLNGGRFVLDLSKKPLALATSAPGMHP